MLQCFLVVGQLRLITDVLILLSENNKEGDVDSFQVPNLQLFATSHQKTSEMQELE